MIAAWKIVNCNIWFVSVQVLCLHLNQNTHTLMKRTLLAFGVGSLIFASCTNAPDAHKAEAGEAVEVNQASAAQTLRVDTAQSQMEWVGTKPTGRHTGYMKIQEGTIGVQDSVITGGRFVIDVNSLQPVDQDAEQNGKLRGHLLSPDFFDAANHPTAVFEIASVQPGADSTMQDATHTITGNLTLKGIAKSISFPARVQMSPAGIVADANFNIDRTQWGMNYMGDASIQDKFINHDVNLKLHLVANK
jgi:polyisoprenoid-binding protein YceI